VPILEKGCSTEDYVRINISLNFWRYLFFQEKRLHNEIDVALMQAGLLLFLSKVHSSPLSIFMQRL
jgi:hypothetical protein